MTLCINILIYESLCVSLCMITYIIVCQMPLLSIMFQTLPSNLRSTFHHNLVTFDMFKTMFLDLHTLSSVYRHSQLEISNTKARRIVA